ncbi:MAG: hypothetical protein M1815_005185 [Lichina confinis]|nr:MAG: hypothetical protein M1815_005185 [Lichina confinis]
MARAVRKACEHLAASYMPDAMIKVEEIDGKMRCWMAHNDVYDNYLDSLSLNRFSLPVKCRSRLFYLQYLDGAGTKAIVKLRYRSEEKFLCKMLDFSDYFLYGDEKFHELRRTWEEELQLLQVLPWHPNIHTPHRFLLTEPGCSPTRVCGMLVPCLSGRTLDSEANDTTSVGVLTIWCLQMSAAVTHTHVVGGQYHMDIRPGNFILDEEGNAKLMNWGQHRASCCTLAPEVDGSIDLVRGSDPDCPSYAPAPPSPDGTGRFGGPGWNVFARWMQISPRAVEAAEVYSLGKAMAFVLVGMKEGRRRVEDEDILAALERRDIPDDWSVEIRRCLCPRPMERPRISDGHAFWMRQLALYPVPAGQRLIPRRAPVPEMPYMHGAGAVFAAVAQFSPMYPVRWVQ